MVAVTGVFTALIIMVGHAAVCNNPTTEAGGLGALCSAERAQCVLRSTLVCIPDLSLFVLKIYQ